jgi:signal transduction histidine kinase
MFMSRTIDDFRNYFRQDKEKVLFNVNQAINRTISIIESSLKNQHITIEISSKDDPVIYGYPNEYSQVILNIFINARDAFLEQGTSKPRVLINICKENEKSVVTVTDNAGGIPENVIYKIFDPYFTTKGPDKGTGIGLFMSKTIIEMSMNGKLTVKNTESGAEFRIEV